MREEKKATAPQVRGDIQKGLTGDIKPGFDPALAPMETDGEAAGTPMTAKEIEIARRTQRADPVDGREDYDVAMREPRTNRTTPETVATGRLRVFIVVMASIAVGIALLTWLYPSL
ncbi:hypothetical protein [Rhizobium sullae]|uniref:Uncharacterized protein n=1 Tax=Rhizobium sullae TaxID=50338 RepID=A0A4R3PSM1_RHISU|nr:hypothetical protein [Rhizobium sullae]TCU07022.1 hypothetical protein EV132_13052 [Rhizobium sullae]